MIKDMPEKQDLLLHLKKVTDILKSHNIHFWMFAGAVIGWERNRDMIPWDCDVDLAYWRKDFNNMIKLKHVFENEGFVLQVKESSANLTWGSDHGIGGARIDLEGDRAVRNRVMTELPPHNKLGNMLYFGILIKLLQHNYERLYKLCRWFGLKMGVFIDSKLSLPAKFYLELKEIDYFGVKLKIPRETEEYLLWVYCKDWRTPKKDGDYYNPEYCKPRKKRVRKRLW